MLEADEVKSQARGLFEVAMVGGTDMDVYGRGTVQRTVC